MSNLLKINLNGSLKKMISGLICLMIVLATFPLHTLQSTVRADEGDPIDLELGQINVSDVSGWMTGQGKLADAEEVKSAGDINITLTNNITVSNANNKMAGSYFFNFTDGRFDGKTITIDGGSHKITISSGGLFFLDLKNCKVILKNITIDGGWNGKANGLARSGSFIHVCTPDFQKSSELLLEDGATIQNCKNSSGDGGGIYVASNGTLTMNYNAQISSCSAFSGASSHGGGYMLVQMER